MDQFTRSIIGFAVPNGDLNGATLCRMFNEVMTQKDPPRYLSYDNDPLFQFHRWRANLRILNIEEVKSIPCTPISHPFVERLIASIRRELMDQTFLWNDQHLAKKLASYQA